MMSLSPFILEWEGEETLRYVEGALRERVEGIRNREENKERGIKEEGENKCQTFDGIMEMMNRPFKRLVNPFSRDCGC